MSNKQNDNDGQKFIVDTKETVDQTDNDMNERINRLFGESTKEAKKEPKYYDPKELATTRKKLLILFVTVVLAGLVIIFLFLNPIKTNNKPNEQEQNNQEENNEENVSIGELDLYSDTVVKLNNRINYQFNDFNNNSDLFDLYKNDVLNTNNISDKLKMYFIAKDEDFTTLLIDNNVLKLTENCNQSPISINKTEFDKILKKLFGENANINYSTINHKFNSKDIILSFENDKYNIKCADNTNEVTITKFIQNKLVKAVGTETGIELYHKLVFITSEGKMGVYKDPTFTTLITDDKTSKLDTYIDKGGTYKYTFVKDGENYYLSKIELVKEDN